MVSISGGPKDSEPPRLLRTLPKDSSINIKPETITLEFNEYVGLLNKMPVYLNPLLQTPLEIEVQAQRAIIKLPKDSLKPNTTYQFNIDSIFCDQHEKNPFIRPPFFFSTGSYADSITLKYSLFNTTALPLNQLQFCLYNSAQDFSKGPQGAPFYRFRGIAQQHSYKGLKPGRYDVFVYNDANKNLIYDSNEEPCAILKNPFTLHSDTSLDLHMFLAEDRPVQIKTYRFINAEQILITLSRKTTFKVQSTDVYAASLNSDSIICTLKTLKDTIRAKVFFPETQTADSIKISRLATKRPTFKPKGIHAIDSGFILEFPAIVKQQDLLNAIRYSSKLDTLHFKPITQFNSISPTHIQCKVTDSIYALQIDSNAFKSINGSSVLAWHQNFQYTTPLKGGTLTVSFVKPLKYPHACLQIRHFITHATYYLNYDFANSIYHFQNIPQGEYELNCISDVNQDRAWTSGSLVKRRLPEPLYKLKNSIRIQNDWETEIKME